MDMKAKSIVQANRHGDLELTSDSLLWVLWEVSFFVFLDPGIRLACIVGPSIQKGTMSTLLSCS